LRELYALIAGFLGVIPGSPFLLILLDVWIIYEAACRYDVSAFGEIASYLTLATFIGFVLKGFANFLHAIPLVGQLANAIVAGVYTYFLYNVVDTHFSHVASSVLPH
jgi:hypothetical protein